MSSEEVVTQVARTSRERHGGAPREDGRWVVPPLTLGRTAAAAVTAQMLPPGHRLGEHVITERRGFDGVCEMYVVTHAERGSLHMARVLRREHAALAPTMLAAARQVAARPHRNLLTILEAGWTEEPTPRAFVVHERLVGRSLASLLAGRGGVEWPLVLAIGLQCAEALEALHSVGLAHTALGPGSAALVHVAGDQFRVVVGGLDHAQTIEPGACATEEPHVGDDLFALGSMLAALAASSAAAGSRVPEMLACMLARMIDPRPAIRPASAGELHDQLAAVHEHIDPDLSGMRMLGEAFHGAGSDDFEVSIEIDEPPAPPRPSVTAPQPTVPVAEAARTAARWPMLVFSGLLCFVAGAAARELQRGDGPAAQAQRGADPASQAQRSVDDDEPSLARMALRRVPEQRARMMLPTLPTTVLPRCDDPPSRGPARTLVSRAPEAAASAAEVAAAEPVEAEVESADSSVEFDDSLGLLPIPMRSVTPPEVDAAS